MGPLEKLILGLIALPFLILLLLLLLPFILILIFIWLFLPIFGVRRFSARTMPQGWKFYHAGGTRPEENTNGRNADQDDDSVCDVECTVINSTVVDEKQTRESVEIKPPELK